MTRDHKFPSGNRGNLCVKEFRCGKKNDGGEDRVVRTKRESESKRKEDKWQACWCRRDQWRVCRMAQASAETLLGYWACQKEKSGLGAIKRAVSKYTIAALA